MKKKKISNPLLKRVPKELVGEWRKYLVIFLFLSLTIGFVAGMYVANHSMLRAVEDGAEMYNLEDGHFILEEEADKELIKKIESGDKVDLRKYYIDEAHDEIDEKIVEEGEKELRKTVEEKLREEVEKQIRAAAEGAVLEALGPMAEMLPEEEKQKAIDEAVDKALSENLEKTVRENLEDAVQEALKSDEYKDELEKARKEAYKEAEDEINDKFDEAEAKKSESQKRAEENFKVTPVTIYENFFKDTTEDINLDGNSDAKVRVYYKNDYINGACFLEGRAPENETEIAIDRMHADNNDISVGDKIKVGEKEFEVVGLLAYVNYSTLYENNTDLMFDAITFNAAMVTREAWDDIDGTLKYCYAFKYKDSYNNDAEQKVLSDNFMNALATQSVAADNELEDYVPVYANQAVIFAPEDMGGDKSMGGVLLYILVVVFGFVFALTTSSTITKESAVIGTLRASGYTRAEITRHYMAAPVLVTLLAAIVGNILGYTAFKQIVVDMYYNSYSLPTYVTYWHYEAFIKTTVVPVILMFIINFTIIARMLRFSPLRFLRHDLRTSKRKKAVRLPKFGFLHRFRLRVMLQNLPNYLVLAVGIFFVVFLLTFAYGLPSTLGYYQEHAVDDMFADYQYILKDTEDEDGETITTSEKSAERFSMLSLVTEYSKKDGESISVYGVETGSDHIKLMDGLSDKKVMVSSAYADKFKLKIGDEIILKDKYASDEYHFEVAGIYEYMGGLMVFMPEEDFNSVFGYPEGNFMGYMSDEPLTDIDDDYIVMTITRDDVTKVSRQLDHSMGGYMDYFKVICLVIAAILLYLLTKIIIEKNENAISMVKILGYTTKEIGSLYLTSTTCVVIISAALSTYLAFIALKYVWEIVLMTKDGWLPAYFAPINYLWETLIVVGAYLIIMIIDYNRIRRIPMDEALKNVE